MFGISFDGLTLAGGGVNIDGRGEGWIAHLDHPLIPEPSSLALMGIGTLALAALALRRLHRHRPALGRSD